MYDVFISYRRGRGSELASSFYTTLEAKGYKCFFDVEGKYSGDFMGHVEEAIKNSNLILMLVTEGSLERFTNPDDISRREIEMAIKYKIDILPISVIGEEIFRIIEELPDMPECVKLLKTFNTRLYKHELRQDTLSYITDLLAQQRIERFKTSNKNILNKVIDYQDENFKEYMEDHKEKQIDIAGKPYLYTGQTIFDKLSGKGVLRSLSDGITYDMEWDFSGDYMGTGDIYLRDKLIYSGEIYDLQYHGQGKLFNGNETYEGGFNNGKYRGMGTLIKGDGTVISGEWLAGDLFSKAYIRYPDGTEYRGKTIDGQPHGHGTMMTNDGVKYEGVFRRGKIDLGAMFKPTSVFIGTFEDEKPDGRGALYKPNFEKVVEGTFKQGEVKGRCKMYIGGKSLGVGLLPKVVYTKLKEYFPSIDSTQYILTSQLEDSRVEDYSDFIIEEKNSRAIVCEGTLRNYDKSNIKFKIKKNFEEVYSHEPELV